MNGFLQRIAGLCLIRMLLDMLLPEGDAASCAGLGVEISMLLCMLHGFASLFGWF